MQKKTVAVIGAGPSGLPTIKNFIDQGFDVTAFDKSEDVGGNWRFNDETGHSSVFETTHIISSKYTSEYKDFPLPKDAPDYPSHEQLLGYFNAYATEFDLRKHIHFKTTVTNAEPIDGGCWRLTWTTEGKKKQTAEFDALCVASGHHHTPRMPEYPGEFSGEYIHSHDYKRAAPFAGKRVLVIGGGNSACDVAVETSRVSQETFISWRRGYWLIPKFILGMPVDKFFYKFKNFPKALQIAGLQITLRLLQGRNRDIGLQDPDHQVMATHPTLNSDLYNAIRHGKVQPKGDIERFDGTVIHFKDGSSREFDTIVACTGFHITHPFLKKSVIDLTQKKVRLYQRAIPEDVPNLYFIGLFQPLGCIWPGAELQAKLAARHLAGTWKPHKPLSTLINAELDNPDVHQVDSPRHTVTVNDLSFRKRLNGALAKATGAKADRVSPGPSTIRVNAPYATAAE